MKHLIAWTCGIVVVGGIWSPSLAAQQIPPATFETDPPAATAAASRADARGIEPGASHSFLLDVAGDYKHFLSKGTASWLSAGLGAAYAAHIADQGLSDEFKPDEGSSITLTGGEQYGGPGVQISLAVGWWAVGHLAGSEHGADAGRDLLRGQISAASWTYALKLASDRTRPNGDPWSFPSGHASSAFATAMVLEQHYGWKLGVPAFTAASYTAASRIVAEKHWASDVVFGAFLGITAGRTVTLHVRNTHLSLAPVPLPGGGAVLLSAMR